MLNRLIECPPASVLDVDLALTLLEQRDALQTWTLGALWAWLHRQEPSKADAIKGLEKVVALRDRLIGGADVQHTMDTVMSAPCFAGAPLSVLMRVAESCTERRLEAGDVLVKQAERDHHLYLVHDGSFVVEVDGATIETLGPGAIVGELAALVDEPRTASVVATRPCTVLMITRALLTQTLEASPALGLAMARVLSARLRSLL